MVYIPNPKWYRAYTKWSLTGRFKGICLMAEIIASGDILRISLTPNYGDLDYSE